MKDLSQLITLLVLSPLVLIRALRWLSIVQQKEYRLDRLRIYLKTKSGLLDLIKLIPTPHDLTRTGLKRPVVTARVAIVALTAGLMLLTSWWFVANWISITVGVFAVLAFVLLPIILIGAIIPSWLVSEFITWRTLLAASHKITHHQPLIIGVTGSYGKTTTKHLIAQVLSQHYSVFVTPRSHNTRYSVAKSILNDYSDQQVAVLEYAAYTMGEIKRLARWFRPTIAVITGLAPQHLELFGSVAAIVKAKSELVKAVPASEPVFCHAADPGTIKICQAGGRERCNAFSGPQGVELKHVGLSQQGTISFVWRGHTIVTELIGLHYLAAIKAAIAVSLHLKLTEQEIVTGLSALQLDSSFIRQYHLKSGTLVIDDGRTSNQAGFTAALDLGTWYRDQGYSVILATGGIVDLGHESQTIHQQLADHAHAVVDQVWYLSQVGQTEFIKTLGTDCIYHQSQILAKLNELSDRQVLLLEGRMPGWLSSAIKSVQI